MREIKFRYWNGITNQMLYDPMIRSDYEFSLGEYMNTDRGWEWMQFTGLHDKNGKEIYFGDCLKLPLLQGDLFSEVKLCEKRQIPVVYFFEDILPEALHCYTSPDKNDSSVEIIGNVYEHPELLRDNK